MPRTKHERAGEDPHPGVSSFAYNVAVMARTRWKERPSIGGFESESLVVFVGREASSMLGTSIDSEGPPCGFEICSAPAVIRFQVTTLGPLVPGVDEYDAFLTSPMR
jgi:hypothetical protein